MSVVEADSARSTHIALKFTRECPDYIHLRHLHVTSFTSPSPALVLQVTNAGVRRPGNEASLYSHIILLFYTYRAYATTVYWEVLVAIKYREMVTNGSTRLRCRRKKTLSCASVSMLHSPYNSSRYVS